MESDSRTDEEDRERCHFCPSPPRVVVTLFGGKGKSGKKGGRGVVMMPRSLFGGKERIPRFHRRRAGRSLGVDHSLTSPERGCLPPPERFPRMRNGREETIIERQRPSR